MPKLAIISKNLLCHYTMTQTVDRTSQPDTLRAECGIKKSKLLAQAEPVFATNLDQALYNSLYDYHGRNHERGERIEVPKTLKDIEDGYIGPLNFYFKQAVLTTLNHSLTAIAGGAAGDLALKPNGDYYGQHKIYRAYATVNARVFVAVALVAMSAEKSYEALLEKVRSTFRRNKTFLISQVIVKRSGADKAETVIVRKLPGGQARFYIDAGYVELTLQTDWVDESQLIPCDIEKAESGEHKKKISHQTQSFGAIIEDKSPSFSYLEDVDGTVTDTDSEDAAFIEDLVQNEAAQTELSNLDRAQEILEASKNLSIEDAPLAKIADEVVAVFEKEVIAGNITENNASQYLISGVKQYPLEGKLSLLPLFIAAFKKAFADSENDSIKRLADITVTAATDYLTDLDFGYISSEEDYASDRT